MITPRTTPNLIEEATYLTDADYSYGALILARALGHAVKADGITTEHNCHCHPWASAQRLYQGLRQSKTLQLGGDSSSCCRWHR